MYGSSPFESILSALRSTQEEADEKRSAFGDLVSELNDAISELDDFSGRIDDAISTIEGLGDLSVSYSFSYEVEDLDLSVEF